MAKDATTWMPLYVSDYHRDTRHLSTVEHGAYLLLIFDTWTRGGLLPLDSGRLARIVGLGHREWAAIEDEVMRFFVRHNDGFRHPRVDRELNRSQALTDQRRSAGRASAAARSSQREVNDRSTTVATVVSTNDQQTARPSPSQSHTPNGVDDANASSATKRGSRLSDDWVPGRYPTSVAALVSQWPPGREDREIEQFCAYWTSLAGKGATKLDWDKTWHNRIRDVHDRLMRENRNGRQLAEQSNPDPYLAALAAARAEAEAECKADASDTGTWLALPSTSTGSTGGAPG